MEIINSFFTDNFWAVVSMIAVLTVPITSIINEKFNVKGVWKQVASWSTGFVLAIAFHFLNVVNFTEPVWVSIILTGIVSGLSSNGIYDIPTIKDKIGKFSKIVTKSAVK